MESEVSNKPVLTYEETPIIDPHTGDMEHQGNASPDTVQSVIPEAAQVFNEKIATPPSVPHSVAANSPQRTGRRFHIGTVLFIVILFGLGVWLSSQIRSFFAPSVSEEIAIPTSAPTANSASFGGNVGATPSATPPFSATKRTEQIISGLTKKPIPGLSYQLPNEVKTPVCDSASCASYGTYLPGGTRFTLAPRGKNQLLPDFRGAILTDAAGREFIMKESSFAGALGYEYVGNFTGRTGGGYTFTAIRGVLLPVSETLAIDFNHFAPQGVSSDFAKDEVVFNAILASFRNELASSGSALPLIPPTGVPKQSTTSGNF